MVNVKKVGKYQVKVYKASNGNYIYLNKNDRELDKRALEAVETAINFLKMKLGTVEQIAQGTGLSLEEVQELAAKVETSA